jgi:hypothetical protein
MSINLSYEYFSKGTGEAHFYYAQYKNNRMKEWRYLRDGENLNEIIKEVEETKKRAEALLATGDKYYRNHYKTMKYRIIKVDCNIH